MEVNKSLNLSEIQMNNTSEKPQVKCWSCLLEHLKFWNYQYQLSRISISIIIIVSAELLTLCLL